MANAVTIKTINDFMIDLKPASSFSIRTEPYLQNIDMHVVVAMHRSTFYMNMIKERPCFVHQIGP
jgi:hypothetical protein